MWRRSARRVGEEVLQGMLENLVYDSNIKWDLLMFLGTYLLLYDIGVDLNIVCCNRVVVLHSIEW